MGNTDRRSRLRLQSGLQPLGEVHQFEVADGDLDIRGWMVASADGATLGTVRELIVDLDLLRARYVVVDLGPPGTNETFGRAVLVPVEWARLDPARDQVMLPDLTWDAVEALPEYTREALDRDYEAGLLRRIGVAAVKGLDDASGPASASVPPPSPPKR